MPIELEDISLIMTASVDPKGMPSAATVPDPMQREGDYITALKYYLTEHPQIRKIVFAENSGWPLDRLRQTADQHLNGQQLEFLSFSLNDFPRQLGKSYGEMLLLDHVFEESALVKSTTYVAKVTGRNRVLNLTRLIQSAPVPLDFYGDLRDHPLYELIGSDKCGRHGESRFFLLSRQFYNEHFRGKYRELDDSRQKVLETLIYNVVRTNLDGKRVIGRFKIEPEFRGIAGHWGKDYGSPMERTKRRVRAFTRRAIPWLWI